MEAEGTIEEQPQVESPPTEQVSELVKPAAPYKRWVDVQAALAAASADMEIGQLIQAPGFGLFEAMSAIEIMDPKMDGAVGAEGVYTLEEARKLNIIQEDLSVPEVLAVMDQLLGCETTWYTGFSIAQTLLTCLYLHDPTTIKNPYLKLYVLTLLRTCEVIRMLVMRADVYEEEDFISNTFGVNLYGIEEEDMFAELKKMEADLSDKIAKRKGGKKDLKNVTPLQDDPDKEVEYCEALLARLRFRKAFYTTLQSLDEPQCSGLESALNSVKSAVAQLNIIRNSLGLSATVLPTNVFEPRICRRMPSVPPRSIDMLTPLAAIKFFEKMFSDFRILCGVVEATTRRENKQTGKTSGGGKGGKQGGGGKGGKKPGGGKGKGGGSAPVFDEDKVDEAGNWTLLQEFLLFVSARNPDVIVRSCLRLVCFHDRKILGRRLLVEVIHENMKQFPLANEIITNQLAVPFIEKVARVLMQQIRILCYNRARQKRKLAHSFFDWAALGQEAETTDQLVHQKKQLRKGKKAQEENNSFIFWFTSWVMDQTFPVMTHFLQLGFELELYHPVEHSMVYWYLDYLFGMQVKNKMEMAEATRQLTGISSNPTAYKKVGETPRTKGRGGNKPQEPEKEKSAEEELAEALVHMPVPQRILLAKNKLCGGLFKSIMAGHLYQGFDHTEDNSPYGSIESRFYSRFNIFHRLAQPQPLYPPHFFATSDLRRYGTTELYKMAAEGFIHAKMALESALQHPTASPTGHALEETKTLIRIADLNLAQIEGVTETIKKTKRQIENQLKVISYDFSQHPFYAVVALVPNNKKKAGSKKQKQQHPQKAQQPQQGQQQDVNTNGSEKAGEGAAPGAEKKNQRKRKKRKGKGGQTAAPATEAKKEGEAAAESEKKD